MWCERREDVEREERGSRVKSGERAWRERREGMEREERGSVNRGERECGKSG